MAENIQWIKLKVGMFDGSSFKKIKRAKIGGVSYRDKLTSVWFELMDLAGKSNANGYLIDNNEIPYRTFEDIAIMLDREEKEIELCMNFFINEQMIEIIDDIFCLSNFMKYQNQEGLDKIREQKRVAQSKWRERKKLGLVGVVDKKTSTKTSTHNLPSKIELDIELDKEKEIYKEKESSLSNDNSLSSRSLTLTESPNNTTIYGSTTITEDPLISLDNETLNENITPPLDDIIVTSEDQEVNNSNTSNEFTETTTDSLDTSLNNKESEKERSKYVLELFDKTWAIYPRKVSKERAKKTWVKKMRCCKTCNGVRNKAAQIYKLLMGHIKMWRTERGDDGDGARPLEYIPHFSSWLNNEIPDD